MTNAKVSPIPPGFQTVTPHLICAGATDAMDFYKKAFNAVELARLLGPDGGLMHGCLRIGNAPIMLGEECPDYGVVGPKSLNGSGVVIHLFVEDVDAFMAHAEAAGAKITMPAADMFWGDRYGQLEDPFGHRWSVATHMQDLTPEQIIEGSKNCIP